jgi:flavodoxin
MRTLVLYDSKYGNTETLARAIGAALGNDTRVLAAGDAGPSDVGGLDLLVVGSPTQGGRPTTAITQVLQRISSDALRDTDVAAFDTRIAAAERGFGLRWLMKAIGYSAPRLARTLQAKGGRLIAAPEGFIVQDTEGPLAPGELERAAGWARQLLTVRPQQGARRHD